MSGSPAGREAATTFVTRVSWVALEFLAGLLIARLLGASEFGAYAIAISVATLGGTVASLGLDRLLVREVAVLDAAREWTRLRALVASTTRWVLGIGIIAAGAIALCAPWIAGTAGSGATHAIRLGAILVPVIAWSRQRQGVLQGLGHVSLGQSPELLLQPLLLMGLIAGALLLTHPPVRASDALLLQIAAAVAAGATSTILMRQRLPVGTAGSVPRGEARSWLPLALPFIVLLSATMALSVIDTLVLGALRGAEAAGPYRAASQMAAFAAMPMTAINMAFAPRLAARHAAGDADGLQTMARQAVRTGAACALGVALILWLTGRLLLGVYGPGFEMAYGPLAILTGAYLFNSCAGISGYLLIMSKHATAAALLFLGAMLLCLLLQWSLVPAWGATGAATATAISLCALTIGLGIAARVLTGVRASLLPA